jgi:lysyl-tRNA synthetase class 1
MSSILQQALQSNSWAFEEAIKILNRYKTTAPQKGYILFETGYGPSGLPHIGTFAEVARTSMVRSAFSQISDIPTKLICFSDDLDGLRKIPSNVPNPDSLKSYMNMPLTSIPDPFGEKESYGHYMNAKLRSFLDRFEFDYEFRSATECYNRGDFNFMLERVIDKYEKIMELMLPTFREERQATYSPFMPICPETGQVLQVPIEHVNKEAKTITYTNLSGKKVETEVINGKCKLQWKPDFGMRWAALDVDYEMYGKDHMPNAKLYSEICRILGGNPPEQFFYELFLDAEGAKISKSKGNSITIDEWLNYAPLESLSLFIYQSPSKAKRLYFDVIPKNVDEYLTFNKKYFAETEEHKKLQNPVHHIHAGNVKEIDTFGVSFSLLLNLASVCNPDNKEVMWGFISQYNKIATPESSPYLDHLIGFAINYYNDLIKTKKQYLEVNDKQKLLLSQIRDCLTDVSDDATSEDIQNLIYGVGRDAGFENLRDFFKEIYMILLGQEEGPRLGSFFKLYGIKNSIDLINSKIQ